MNGAETAALILPVLCGLGLVGIAALVARTGWQHRHNRLFASLYLLSGINSISHGLLSPFAAPLPGQPTSPAALFHQGSAYFPDAMVWLYVQVLCTVLMLPLLFLFVLNFPRPMPWIVRRPRLQWLAFTVSLVFGAVLLVPPEGLALHLLLDAFNVLATAVTLAATYMLWRTHARSPSPIERRQAGYLLVGFVPAFAATGAITLLGYLFGPAGAVPYQKPILFYVSPPLELLAAAFTAFAILKYRLLDFELQVRGGMRYVLMTLTLGAAILVIEVYVGNFILQNQVFSFLGEYGSAALAAVTGIALFKPLHKVSGKVTDRLFPEATAPKVDYERARAREIYQAQATHVLRDAKVTDRELSFLRTLRDQLGLSAAEAEAIEEGVERNLGVDSHRTGHSPTAAPAPIRDAPVQRVQPSGGPPAQRAPPPTTARPTAPKAPAAAPPAPGATAPSPAVRSPVPGKGVPLAKPKPGQAGPSPKSPTKRA